MTKQERYRFAVRVLFVYPFTMESSAREHRYVASSPPKVFWKKELGRRTRQARPGGAENKARIT